MYTDLISARSASNTIQMANLFCDINSNRWKK